MLGTLITSKTRIKLLTKFFVNASNSGYLRGLSKEFNESTNAIRKELNKLTKAGYLELINDKSQKKLYRANTQHPLYSAIHNIVLKELGLDSLVASILDRMGGVNRVIVVGDYAQGVDSGEIEVVIEGDQLNTAYLDKLSSKIENKIGRRITFLITSAYHKGGLTMYNAASETT